MKRFYLFLLIMLCCCFLAEAQYYRSRGRSWRKKRDNYWAITAHAGVQMAGLAKGKWQNFQPCPLLIVSADKMFNSSVGLRVGLQGPYFKFQEEQHNYLSLFSEVMFNTNSIANGYNRKRIWLLNINVGCGLLYDFYANHMRFCLSGSITNSFRVMQALYVNLHLSSLFGWNIYELNDDLIPGLSVGVTYKFL